MMKFYTTRPSLGWGARRFGSPFGQRAGTGVVGVGVGERVCVGSACGLGEPLTIGLGVGPTACRKLPMMAATATTAVTTTASTPMISAIRRLGDGRPAPPSEAFCGVDSVGPSSAGPGWLGSSVVTVDHREPSQ